MTFKYCINLLDLIDRVDCPKIEGLLQLLAKLEIIDIMYRGDMIIGWKADEAI